MKEEISTETIYDGSEVCRKCGALMTPLEVFYMDGDICPYCRNAKYGQHVQGAMSGR